MIHQHEALQLQWKMGAHRHVMIISHAPITVGLRSRNASESECRLKSLVHNSALTAIFCCADEKLAPANPKSPQCLCHWELRSWSCHPFNVLSSLVICILDLLVFLLSQSAKRERHASTHNLRKFTLPKLNCKIWLGAVQQGIIVAKNYP